MLLALKKGFQKNIIIDRTHYKLLCSKLHKVRSYGGGVSDMKASNLLLYFVQDNPTPLQQELEGKMRLCRLTQSQSCSQIATFSNASNAQRIQGP